MSDSDTEIVTSAPRKASSLVGQQTSDSPEWGTPRHIVDLARACLGTISIDPFSSTRWNTLVGARRIISPEDGGDGFTDEWISDDAPAVPTAFVNPPGDKSGGNVKRAWARLSQYWVDGKLAGGAFWVGFSIAQLQTLQGEGPVSPLDPALRRCIPRSRVCYLTAPETTGGAPPHPSWVCLFPAMSPAVRERQLTIFGLMAGAIGDTI